MSFRQHVGVAAAALLVALLVDWTPWGEAGIIYLAFHGMYALGGFAAEPAPEGETPDD